LTGDAREKLECLSARDVKAFMALWKEKQHLSLRPAYSAVPCERAMSLLKLIMTRLANPMMSGLLEDSMIIHEKAGDIIALWFHEWTLEDPVTNQDVAEDSAWVCGIVKSKRGLIGLICSLRPTV